MTRLAARLRAVPLLLLLGTGPVWAGGGEGHSFSPYQWTWFIINFVLLFGGLFLVVRFRVLGRPIRSLFEKRGQEIAERLAAARRAQEAAERTLAELNAKVENLDAEISAILAQARQDAETDADSAERRKAELTATLMEQMEREIANRVKQARREIQATAADLALDLAQKLLREDLGPADQQRLVSEFLSRLETRH